MNSPTRLIGPPPRFCRPVTHGSSALESREARVHFCRYPSLSPTTLPSKQPLSRPAEPGKKLDLRQVLQEDGMNSLRRKADVPRSHRDTTPCFACYRLL